MVSTNPPLPEEVTKVDPRPFLSCHAYASPGLPVFYSAWPGRLGALEQISYRLKLEMEFDHWLRLCLRLASPEHRQVIGPLFRSEFGDLDEGGIARTLRVLRGLEALLLDGSPFYPSIKEIIKESSSTAFQRVETLKGPTARIPAGFSEPDWVIYLPLLLIRAAVWSQTGRQQPYLWEAYSALRTQQAHERPGWLGEAGRRILTFLVRFQSAPGQYVRKTGDTHFLEASQEVAKSTQLNQRVLLTLLGVLAVAQDFRNRPLNPNLSGATTSQGPAPEERKLVGRDAYEHPYTDFKPFWALVDSQSDQIPEDHHRASTWSYSRWLGPPEKAPAEAVEKVGYLLTSAEVEQFFQLVESSHPGVAVFSFGRDYRSEVQKRRVIGEIRNVLNNPQALKQTFTFNLIPVPDCLNHPGKEILMEIRLTDDVTATDMVFRGLEPTKPAEGEATAWATYTMLFETALKEGLIRWPTVDKEASRRYCPTALVKRFLEVAHRLHPADCVSIPIRFGEDRSYFLHLPKMPAGGSNDTRPEVRAAARYVPAWVLNQIMMQEVLDYQVALEDLNESEEGKLWKELIDSAIKTNRFKVLLDNYLGDYLAEPEQTLLNQGLLDLLPPAVKLAPAKQPAPDPGSETHALLRAIKAADECNSPVLLGIDIGGTFIKMRFFQLEYDPETGGDATRLTAIGRDFRVLTASGDGPAAWHGDQHRTEEQAADQELQARLKSFVARLSARIHDEAKTLGWGPVVAIGVTWPGPVRRQRVQGWSGILKKLGFFGRETPIKRIMGMNFVGSLAEEVFGKEAASRAVALINDGDAHALGILAHEFLARRLGSHDDDELGVVVKAGTGTAGALIRNGLPQPGLMEFGKLLMNLAYEPEEFEFPAGLANKYCSSKTLRELMEGSLARLSSLQPPIESIEVGRLAELSLELEREKPEEAREVLRNMAWDSGKIAIAGILQKTAPEIDTVALQDLCDNWLRGGVELKAKVVQCLALNEDGLGDGGEALRERIREYGENRLRALLGLTARDSLLSLRRLLGKDEATGKNLTEEFEEFRETARCARRAMAGLGTYVGDLLALMYFTHRMAYAVLGGGVLSQTSGRLAAEAAVTQLNMYNEIEAFWEERAGNIHIRFSRDNSASTNLSRDLSSDGLVSEKDRSGEDPGTLGAALAGALELLRQKRLDGLKQVIEIVHGLALMDTLEILDTEVTSQGRQLLNLENHALEAATVREYLDQAASRLGLVRTGKATYTRWFAS